MVALIIEILLFDPAACLYYSDEWSFTVLLVMSGRSCIQIISRSCTVTMRVTKAYRQRNENERWKANSGTRLRRDVVHGDICRSPRVCGSRNGNRSSSILAVAFEDRYTLQSVVTVGGSRLVDPRFTFRTNRRRAASRVRSVRSLCRKLCFTRIKTDVECRH